MLSNAIGKLCYTQIDKKRCVARIEGFNRRNSIIVKTQDGKRVNVPWAKPMKNSVIRRKHDIAKKKVVTPGPTTEANAPQRVRDNVNGMLSAEHVIKVIPSVYCGPHVYHGNFSMMIAQTDLRERSVFLFNDNVTCFWRAHYARENAIRLNQSPGGGNAIIRPYETEGHAIGVPTGPFSSLDEKTTVSFGDYVVEMVARDIISVAFDDVVKLFVADPKKKTLYYSCASATDNSIGLGIFKGSVGEDVVEFITREIHKLPSRVHLARTGRALPTSNTSQSVHM
jgi:hypothetical protein